ncbi:MAG: LacI family DNA-binding transcriptional regulator, partial [Clostridia bacterium]
MANLKEIADLAEVSLSTVSRVLNKDETIKI